MKTKLTMVQVIRLLDEMPATSEIKIRPLCFWRNGKAIKTDHFIVETEDEFIIQNISEIKK